MSEVSMNFGGLLQSRQSMIKFSASIFLLGLLGVLTICPQVEGSIPKANVVTPNNEHGSYALGLGGPPAFGSSKHVSPDLVKETPGHLDAKRRRSISGETKEFEPSGENEVQNNVDSLWTWSVNGAKVAGSLVIITGAIKIMQTVLRYWTDEVVTWWSRMKRRWATLGTKDISSDDED
jgi:hypothetical protein